MIKHVGKHNGRRVAIIYRKVPDEGHMALVVYTDTLPSMIHDESMKVLESAVGQNAKELADALFRHTMPDGANCLHTIHSRGYMKKVPTNQVIVTPTAKSSIKLDELYGMLVKIEEGGDALKDLQNIDANRGTRGVLQEGRELGQPKAPPSLKTTSGDMTGDIPATSATAGVLSDADIANMQLSQAEQMEAQAKSLLAEAKLLKAEAAKLAPAKKAPAKAKAVTAKTTTAKATNVRTTKTKKTA